MNREIKNVGNVNSKDINTNNETAPTDEKIVIDLPEHKIRKRNRHNRKERILRFHQRLEDDKQQMRGV